MGEVRLDEDEIDIPGAERAGVTDLGALQFPLLGSFLAHTRQSS